MGIKKTTIQVLRSGTEESRSMIVIFHGFGRLTMYHNDIVFL